MRDVPALALFRLPAVCLVTIGLSACSDQPTGTEPNWAVLRQRMVDKQLVPLGIRDGRVLIAMNKVPRHEFVPRAVRDEAYEDRPLPIGHEQTISQPFIVAFMTERINPMHGRRILEVGTGSGYQAAVLAYLDADVYTIELIPELARDAAARLKKLGYKKVHVREGDGYEGWPEEAPFDAILVTCGADHVPEPLFAQLKEGGTMVIPVGDPQGPQSLRLVRKWLKGEQKSRDLMSVQFVPLRRAGEGKK